MAINLARYWVTIHADWTQFRTEVRAEAGRLAGTNFNVRPNLDITAFRAQFRVFEAVYLRDRSFNVTPHLNHRTLINSTNATFNTIIHNSERSGDRAGKGFLDSFTKRWQLIGGAVVSMLPLLQPVVQVLGDIAQGVAAVGASLPAAMAAGALAVGTLVAAFHNLNKAIQGQFSGDPTKAEREAFDKLSTSAKQFVRILLEMRTGLKGAQTEIQESFFKPFNEGFKKLVSGGLFQLIRKEMSLTAESAGKSGAGIAAALAESAKSGQLQVILDGSRKSLEGIFGVMPRLVGMFLTLAEAAQPFVQALTVRAVNGINALILAVDKANGSGGLAAFFDEGRRQVFAFVDLVGNLGSIFKTIFGGISGGSDSALQSFAALTQQFDNFLKSAQGSQIIGLIADKLSLIGDILKTVLGPVLPIILQLAQIISGALNGAIRQLLPAVGNLLSAIAQGLQPILTALAPVFDRLVTVLADFLVLAIREVTAHVNKMMPTLVELMQRLGPQLIPLVEAFGQALLALIPIIPAISEFLAAMIPIVLKLLPVLEAMITVTTFLWKVIAVVIEWMIKLGVNIDALQFIFQAFALVIGTVASAVRSAWDATWAFLRDSIFGPMQRLITETLPAAWRRGVDLIGFWWDALRDLAAKPVRFVIETIVNKGIIGTFNKIAGFFGADGVNEVPVPFAYGGFVSGPGGPTDDMVPAWLSNGEYVIPANIVRSYGVRFFNQLIGRPTTDKPGDGSNGIAFAAGGLVGLITDPVGWVKDHMPSLGSIPGGGVFKKILVGAGGKMISGLIEWAKNKVTGFFSGDGTADVGGDIGAIQAWIRAQNGKPYGWAQAGPSAYDCSGIVSAVWNLLHGRNPYSHTFSTHSEAGYFPNSGWGLFTAGWANSGERGGGSVGHTAANLAGLAFESTGSRGVHIGSSVTPLTNFAHLGHMANGGLVARLFDSGGIWPSGTLGLNMSGKDETVIPGDGCVSLSDGTIVKLGMVVAEGVARALGGSALSAVHVGRARA